MAVARAQIAPMPSIGGDEVFRALSACSPVGLFLTDPAGRCTYTNPRYQAICGVPLEASLGDGWIESIHPDDRAAAAAAWAVAAGGGQEYAIEPRIRRPDGTVRWVRARAAPLCAEDGTLLGYVGTLEDVTERIEAQQRLERRVRALTEIAASLTFDQPMEATLDALAASVVRVSRAVACAVTLIDEATGVFRLVGMCGLPDGYAAAVESSYRAGANLASLQAYRERRPVVRSLRAYVLRDPQQAPVHALIRDAAWDAIVSVPLVFHDRPLGAMSCSYAAGVEPDEDEIAFLLTIADQAAVAVESARLFAEAQGKAALEERQRLARELHDSVSQALYGIGLGARTARTLLDRDPRRAAEPLDYVLALAQAGMAEMRALIFELRPESLAEEGLVAALGRQAAALRARHQVDVEAELCPEPAVPYAVKEALYRVAQEALHNAVKHAGAARLGVRLAATPAGLVLEVSDDGEGFDAGGSFPGHLGLRSMRERVERLGGALSIASAPGRGTLIRAEIPPPTET